MRTMAFLKSGTLYAAILLLIGVIFLGVKVSDVKDSLVDPRGFSDWFLYLGAWSIPAFILVTAFDTIFLALRNIGKQYPRRASVRRAALGGTRWALIGPFHGPTALATNKRVNDLSGFLRKKSQIGSLVHFIYSIFLAIYLLTGLLVLGRTY